ncbi:MAG: hypothetical protein ACREUH_05730 [Burkholderiales bacterium]
MKDLVLQVPAERAALDAALRAARGRVFLVARGAACSTALAADSANIGGALLLHPKWGQTPFPQESLEFPSILVGGPDELSRALRLGCRFVEAQTAPESERLLAGLIADYWKNERAWRLTLAFAA